MKPTYFKSIIAIAILCIGFNMNAQNTSLGVVGGTYNKDTTLNYTEDPESHAHVKTRVINNDKDGDKSGTGSLQAADMADTTVHARQDNVAAEAENTVTDGGTAAAIYAESDTTPTSEDMCSCSSLHLAYGIAGVGILGMLIFLALYLNEKSKGRKADNRA